MLAQIEKTFRSLAADECGATAIEYTLIACIFAVISIGAASLLGNNIATMWVNTANTITNAGS